MHTAIGCMVDRRGERVDKPSDVLHGHRPALAQHDVERVADGVFLREIRGAVIEPRGDGRSDIR